MRFSPPRIAERACAAALDAATAVRKEVVALNARRGGEGLPVTDMYLGLHVGEVFYGNIGSTERLDFTVVGPAVNEASRIAAMCRSVEQPVLVSEAFANVDGMRDRLVSVGRYALRGVAKPQEFLRSSPPTPSSGLQRRLPNRRNGGLTPCQFATHDGCSFDHGAHFCECDIARKIFQPAIRRHHDVFGRHVLQRASNACGHVSGVSIVMSDRSSTPRMMSLPGSVSSTDAVETGLAVSIETLAHR